MAQSIMDQSRRFDEMTIINIHGRQSCQRYRRKTK